MKQEEVPAQKLVGLELKNGWKVVEKYVRTDGLSAGRYSVGYFVERGKEKGFLKAIDYSRATEEDDMPAAMLQLVQSFQFERSVLDQCSARHMDKVISPRDDGEVKVDDSQLGRVNYLIFDRADGDVRNTLAAIETYELVRRLRILHHVATGICQLHDAGIAHQDLKPSNVLSFGEISKVSDLGCVSIRGVTGPSDLRACAGDKDYAPLELLYGQIDPDFNVRRFGCDCYLLGSLLVFLFSGVGVTCSVLSHLPAELKPKLPSNGTKAWDGNYRDVLPYVQNAFGQSMGEFATEIRNSELRLALSRIVRQLCEPDPALRGHPLARRQKSGNPFALERYRTEFDLLATRASLGFFPEEK
jgi:serine/threonine protein kinase